jgi:hypothetical protein
VASGEAEIIAHIHCSGMQVEGMYPEAVAELFLSDESIQTVAIIRKTEQGYGSVVYSRMEPKSRLTAGEALSSFAVYAVDEEAKS